MSNNNQQEGLQAAHNDGTERGQMNNQPADNNNNNDDGNPVVAVPNPLPPGTVIVPPRPFQIPRDARYVNRATGRIQLRVSKQRKGARYICKAEGINGVFQTTPLFVIERQGRRGFRIFDVSNDNGPDHVFTEDDPRFAGEVRRSVHRLGGFVEYKLVRNGQQLEATTIMAISSLRYPVVNGYADRIVYSVVEDQSVSRGETTTMDPQNPSLSPPEKAGFFFECLNNKPVIEHISDDIHKIVEGHKELKVLQSKRRFTNGFGRKVHRDLEPFQQKFYGRAHRASKKNLQIMDVSSGKVMLQVGRLNKNNFALDFLPPYTPFQALGLCLAQLDAN